MLDLFQAYRFYSTVVQETFLEGGKIYKCFKNLLRKKYYKFNKPFVNKTLFLT